MSVASGLISFMRETGSMSLQLVSKATGIPSTTLSYVSRGLRELPKQYGTALRNAYQRTSYNAMRETGYSTHQASRWRGYAPSTVNERIQTLDEKINWLTDGAVEAHQLSMRLPPSYYGQAYWDQMREQIKQGISESPKPWEDIDNYGKEQRLSA